MRRLRAAAAVAVMVLSVLGAAGCSGHSAQDLCDTQQQRELLAVQFQAGSVEFSQPSSPFSVGADDQVWIEVTRRNSFLNPDSIIPDVGEEVYVLGAQGGRNLFTDSQGHVESHDQSISLAGDGWTLAPISSGVHRLYAFEDPAIHVIACPSP